MGKVLNDEDVSDEDKLDKMEVIMTAMIEENKRFRRRAELLYSPGMFPDAKFSLFTLQKPKTLLRKRNGSISACSSSDGDATSSAYQPEASADNDVQTHPQRVPPSATNGTLIPVTRSYMSPAEEEKQRRTNVLVTSDKIYLTKRELSGTAPNDSGSSAPLLPYTSLWRPTVDDSSTSPRSDWSQSSGGTEVVWLRGSGDYEVHTTPKKPFNLVEVSTWIRRCRVCRAQEIQRVGLCPRHVDTTDGRENGTPVVNQESYDRDVEAEAESEDSVTNCNFCGSPHHPTVVTEKVTHGSLWGCQLASMRFFDPDEEPEQPSGDGGRPDAETSTDTGVTVNDQDRDEMEIAET